MTHVGGGEPEEPEEPEARGQRPEARGQRLQTRDHFQFLSTPQFNNTDEPAVLLYLEFTMRW
jgi:hypothetical protein